LNWRITCFITVSVLFQQTILRDHNNVIIVKKNESN
jgi:hypothetical protein